MHRGIMHQRLTKRRPSFHELASACYLTKGSYLNHRLIHFCEGTKKKMVAV
jgi:hypothetical protein